MRAPLAAAGFDRDRLVSLALTLTGDVATRRDTRNRVSGVVSAPRPEEVVAAPRPDDPATAALVEQGWAAIARGELAFVVMAGGMATRKACGPTTQRSAWPVESPRVRAASSCPAGTLESPAR